jgi:hypothetical protein
MAKISKVIKNSSVRFEAEDGTLLAPTVERSIYMLIDGDMVTFDARAVFVANRDCARATISICEDGEALVVQEILGVRKGQVFQVATFTITVSS